MNKMLETTVALCAAALLAQGAVGATLDESESAFREVYRELVEINTTLSSGSCTDAARAMADRLRSAGIPDENIHVIVPPDWPRQGNLVASLPGLDPDAGAILLLAHIDVVEANPEDWERDPFTLIEEDGYFFGRGTVDDKAMAAIFVDLLMRMSASGYRPERTVKLALTCGEETPNTFNGVRYLLEHDRDLIDADFALNEGAISILDAQGNRIYNGVQAGEKTYQDYRLEIRNPGGHSSRPVPENAIYQLASALLRIADYAFPVEFNDTTRSYFERMSAMTTGQTSADLLAILESPPAPEALARITANPSYNAMLHTTCVATMLDAGHAPNALPQRADANVNCRIFPGHTQEEIRQELERVVADPDVTVSFVDPPESTSPPPPLTEAILGPIEAVTQQMWPGVPVLPFMQAGGTDGRFLTPAGIPTYGISGLFVQPEKVYAHGLNERVPVESLYQSRVFLDRLVKIYAGGE
jgi:acetylornithine deacetylase/succinyl-diaminopimelate desuccinylase-like protein